MAANGVDVKMGVSGVAQFKQDINAVKQSLKTMDSQLALTEKEFKATGDQEKYLKDNIRSEWKVKDYKISNECLVCDNGKIYLSVSVELIIMKNGTEANTLCALRVSK